MSIALLGLVKPTASNTVSFFLFSFLVLESFSLTNFSKDSID
jgi:hypothetical protein